ncbi:MAG: prepilin-type N-terminal cleavage/methylation domain-containing protein [Gemmatimonadetes bacterium]|uniref:Prepilin-type N-terminal cleavage/methylation domain-containing protein n=1 Tax=Candidatus Kutchimonas denitrificans TaxID=3056748 RepID=A0AAE4Z7P9_9BACT|nr:prepilin-type N-terminal cleavage/methylation domain-containing protein [Gemmatimonadota bacterium]NIR75188.1 prepilin-type N-terminal cleavage/methylation domain-containing protein [Candidatus Kutchimonas denitrificans]NIS00126.1 prepilin-type N-terminal cleavage/methylation domain-containing protein [Gemmatimonadota bacterium]NIT65718.1 prepilin-type N-terminal cleavage/methylation domain-containing protein [Gemmatimonadota bacterium]NIU52996.1 prepilin-type N-terminal cleavage/methylation
MRARAFTLLETLVALAVVGVLIGVVGIRYINAKRTAYLTRLQAELRDLVTAQEAYYGASGTTSAPRYAETLEQLGFVPHADVTIEMRGGRTGWSAKATSIELPEDTHYCAVYIGEAEPFEPAREEGEISCLPAKRDVL